ncbi:MAG: 30S ribosomal protein S16 [Candidatus Shapirobacteria bacterium]|jgi:small subunit ribosomal protein S16|nr:30S ribosomal protein S16 [Candidatus Shapirobacteria bacterium]
MLKIKLKPTGKIHQRSFRIVVAPDRSKANGKFIDDLGFYTPTTKTLQIDKDKMAEWLKNGAQLTTGVDKLLNPDKYPRKKKKKKVEEKIEKKIEKAKEESKEEVKEVKTEEVKEEVSKENITE